MFGVKAKASLSFSELKGVFAFFVAITRKMITCLYKEDMQDAKM